MSVDSVPATVLIVEDDPSLRRALSATLKAAGYRPVTARDATEGLRWYAHYAPDLVLLDLGLPDRDGLTVIRDIRARGATPIIVLSARSAEAVKVEALDLGADDYVNKPFGFEELLARMRAGLRHGVQVRGADPVIRTGGLSIDMGRRRVELHGRPCRLSPKEFALLAELAVNLGRTVKHAQLLKTVWGREGTEIQYLRVYVGQLRERLGDAQGSGLIATDPGVGYRLEERPPV